MRVDAAMVARRGYVIKVFMAGVLDDFCVNALWNGGGKAAVGQSWKMEKKMMKRYLYMIKVAWPISFPCFFAAKG